MTMGAITKGRKKNSSKHVSAANAGVEHKREDKPREVAEQRRRESKNKGVFYRRNEFPLGEQLSEVLESYEIDFSDVDIPVGKAVIETAPRRVDKQKEVNY